MATQGHSRIVDQYGRPIEYRQLTEELATPRLASVLQAAAEGHAHDYLTLAEEMEERDMHYVSVLSTHKLAIAGLSVRVEAASDEREDVRELAGAPAFSELVFDLVDALGKSYAVSEILWDRSGREWRPERFEARDQRFFQFDRETGRELRLLDEADPVNGLALAPFKFIVHTPRIRSGLPIRGGLARLAAVGYVCKAWSWKDWMAFADVFGMPMRVGRYGPAASDDDIGKLLSAVANLGSDAAAVIPDSMRVEFQQAVQVAGAGEFFRSLAEFWDQQISKAVVGQTMTSDDGSSMAQANIHNEVRLDILEADALALSNTLQRQLVRPFIDLNYGSDRPYPRLSLAVPQPEDNKLLVDALAKLVPLGLEVEQSVIRDKFNLPDPVPDAKLLSSPKRAVLAGPAAPQGRASRQATNAEQRPAPVVDIVDRQIGRMEQAAAPALDDMLDTIRGLVDEVDSLEALRDRLIEAYPEMPGKQLADTMAEGMIAASLAGRDDVLRGL
ncbi:DUF935 domain-containing protein [Halomonas sp. YLB-10]|uniref:DUF935 domain-containing protein n=1 Tax=Halomonas sp. YLB-10 TaxID=2483111 RepID=UPI000F5ED670|nr:DUF935 domain-containing protein [Halomonas sp. YLB-10]RQW70340.1 DUF935 domain-containing protein [Halomonas sp. YLB-10]